jgi:hypothetical protein
MELHHSSTSVPLIFMSAIIEGNASLEHPSVIDFEEMVIEK